MPGALHDFDDTAEPYVFQDDDSLSDPDDGASQSSSRDGDDELSDLDSVSSEEGSERDDTYSLRDDDDDDEDEDDRIPPHARLLTLDDRFNSSWSLLESMDTDSFFMIPPSGVMPPPNLGSLGSPRSFGRRPFILPSSAMRRNGGNGGLFSADPPTGSLDPTQGFSGRSQTARLSNTNSTSTRTDTEEENTTSNDAEVLRTYEAPLNVNEAISRSNQDRQAPTVADKTKSPTVVATHNLATIAEPQSSAFAQYQTNHDHQHHHQPHHHHHHQYGREQRPLQQSKLSGPPATRGIPRNDSLTFSVLSSGFSTDGKSSKNETPGSVLHSDNEEATPFRNLYDDDISLYLDDDCLTECAEPPFKADKAFVTRQDINEAAITQAHDIPPLIKWWKTLTNFCRPHRIRHQTVPAKPSVAKPGGHNRSRSDPELMTNMLEDRLIMTKRSVEAAPFKPLNRNEDADKKTLDATSASGPPVVIKFRPSHATSSCIQELAFQIDSKADFVLDDTRSLPDDMLMPNLEDWLSDNA